MGIRQALGTRSWGGLVLAAAAATLAAETAPSPPSPQATARAILRATGIRGGLIVHLDCGDGRLTAALRAGPAFLVHGLQTDADRVARARAYVRARGLYGPVAIDRFDGTHLPYADDLVDLVVAADLGAVPMDEVMRVLSPRGIAYIRRDGRWTKTVKPRPQDIDEWTHFLHDASNNAVARDRRVGPPRRLQWRAGPLWCRSHEFISSFCAMVTGGGRLFSVVDTAQASVTDPRLPERWTLIARDAFNGVRLWERPLPAWRGAEWKSRAMRGRPPSVPRRLVPDGDRLYATLSHRGPVSVLDAATGETLRTIDGTGGAQEILLTGRTLLVRLAPLAQADRDAGGAIAAIDAESGRILWRARARRYLPQSLAAGDGRVIYNDGAETVCLRLADGAVLWRGPSPRTKGRRRGQRTFILYGDLVLEGDRTGILARSAKTGEVLWTAPGGGGSMRPHDLFVVGARVWRAAAGGIAGYDLATGERVQVIDPSGVQSRGHHLRCYRAKATERYLITQFRGAEFVSLTGEAHRGTDWIRGPCRYGVMPANGMLYVPPHQCFCYPGAIENGLNAFATASDAAWEAIGARGGDGRLERGPAYGAPAAGGAPESAPGEWPTYRHDARRLGATPEAVPASVAPLWRTRLGGRLTPPVVAGGRLLVAQIDAHTVHALDARTGEPAWCFVAGGRVDSPPTVFRGRVLFGCADGWLYGLRASDGVLAWRFRAAPAERRIVAFDQLESAWPVHGSVLVLGDTVYCTAGRSTFLDGGIFAYGLDPQTGAVRCRARLDTLRAGAANATTTDPRIPCFTVEGARSDILSSDGTSLYLGPIRLAPDLTERPAPYVYADEADRTVGMDISRAPYVHPSVFRKDYETYASWGVKRGPMGCRRFGRHVFSTAGFLDDAWFNRTFWMYAETWPGFQIAHLAAKTGQILVVDETTTYSVQAFPARQGLSPHFIPAEKGYLLLADANDNEPVLDHRTAFRDKGMGFTRAAPPKWYRWVPVRVRALVAAGPTLFAAGPPDAIGPDDPWAAFEGRKGAVLLALAKADGRTLAEAKLDAPPVFDGLIAAGGRLFLSMRDGTVLCLGPSR